MTREPVTTLDPRFSEPGTAPATWSETLEALEGAQLSWLTTVRADGRPHVTPLVTVWLDDAVHFSTGASEQKAVNLQSNQHVVITTGCNEWERGLDVVVEGNAIRVTDSQLLDRLAKAWTAKWDGRWRYEVRDGAFQHNAGEALVFAVRPVKVLAFGKNHFSQTRHRF